MILIIFIIKDYPIYIISDIILKKELIKKFN